MKDIKLSFFQVSVQLGCMGKRSGIPHRDAELQALSREQLAAELRRSQSGLAIAPSARIAKDWQKRIHWLEKAITSRD
jgi:hypothetical protein